jgi:hypothetical protein
MIGEAQLGMPGAAIDAGIAIIVHRGDADDRQHGRLVGLPDQQGPVRRQVPFAKGVTQPRAVGLSEALKSGTEIRGLGGAVEVHLDAAADLADASVDLGLDAEARLVGMQEDEFVIVVVRQILSGHRERVFVEIAVEVIDHVSLDIAIDRNLGDRRRHVGARRDGDGKAGIVIGVAPVARQGRGCEVHPRAPFEGQEACPLKRLWP